MKLEGRKQEQNDHLMLTGAGECLTPASYTPVLHDVEVPQLHDLLLPLVDICELLDLLQEEHSSDFSQDVM